MTSFPVAQTPLKSGMIIAGKYRLLRPIGAGGMGEVWAAKNERLAREVALKLIRRRDDDLRWRLQREARACGPLRHRNVIDVYDVVETEDGEPVLVMQLLTGETLADLLARRRRLDPPLAAQIGHEIASALAAVHAIGVVHRDLKPANIFLHRDAEGQPPVVKVLDFGISKNVVRTDSFHTVMGGVVGSTFYMSPEQVQVSRDIDHRADIWALGVVLFEMLTGRRPFQGETSSVVMQIIRGEVPKVSWFVRHVDPLLVETVAGCMRRERELRLGPAAEIARRLAAFTLGVDPWGVAPVASSRAGGAVTSARAGSSSEITVRRGPALRPEDAGRSRADDEITTRKMVRPAAALLREPSAAPMREPAPASVRELGPVSARELAPLSMCEPAPASVREPAPASVREPGPVSVREPGPVSVRELALLSMCEPAPATVGEPAPPSYGTRASPADLAAGAVAFYRIEAPARSVPDALSPPNAGVMSSVRPALVGAPTFDRGAARSELQGPPEGGERTLAPTCTPAPPGGEAPLGTSSDPSLLFTVRRGDPCAASVSAGVTVDAAPAPDEPQIVLAERPEGSRARLILVLSAAICAVYLSGGVMLAALAEGSQRSAEAGVLSRQTGPEHAPRSEHAVSPSSPALLGSPMSAGRDRRCEITSAGGVQAPSPGGKQAPSAGGMQTQSPGGVQPPSSGGMQTPSPASP